MLGGEAITDGLRRSAREMLVERTPGRAAGESERAKAKVAKSARRSSVARKYLIETFGCQMNVHDSERMAGLLEQAGFEATDDAADADVVVINTCSVRERAEEKLYTRLGELRQMAAEQGHDPIVAVAGCVAQQEGEAILKRSPGVADVIIGTQAIRRLPMLVEQAARDAPRRSSTSTRYDDVTFPLGVTRRSDPVKAYVTIIEGCNEFCSFCVVPYTRGHERMRPKADILAEVREAAGERAPRSAAARADRQPLRRAGRPVVRLQRPARGDPRRRRHRADPVREPASAARLAALPRGDGAAAEDLPAPAPAGAVRARRACSRRCGAATRARATSSWSTRIRDTLPDVALSTDMIVGFPGETDADFEDTLTLTRGGAATTACSRSSTRRGRTRWPRSGWPDDVPEAEKTRRIVALQALQREHPERAERSALVGRDGRRAGGRGQPAARDRALRPDEHATSSSTCRGRPDWIGRTLPVRDRARRAAQRLGGRGASIDSRHVGGA